MYDIPLTPVFLMRTSILPKAYHALCTDASIAGPSAVKSSSMAAKCADEGWSGVEEEESK